MIDARELRIGNLFYDDDGFVVRMTGMTPHSHLVRCDTNEGCVLLFDFVDGSRNELEVESTECNPIPLNPEILEKAGFEKKGGEHVMSEYYFEKWFIQLFKVSGNTNDYQLRVSGKFIPTMIEYTHQLQNLYYLLTMKELNITL